MITTAPTARQVRSILWKEIRTQFDSAKIKLPGECFQTELRIKPNWFALGLSTKEADKFQGFHEKNIFFIFDEAAGIPQTIFHAMSGCLTSENAKLLLLGNPSSLDGEFYDAFHAKREFYNPISISAFETPNLTGERYIPGLVTREWVEEKRKEWGENSPLWQVKVLGEFPTSAFDSLIPLSAIERAVNQDFEDKEDEAIFLGIDIARYGDDKTVIVARNGGKIRDIQSWGQCDLMETTGRIINYVNQIAHPVIINCDVIGLGAGVVDRLRELNFKVSGINVAEKPSDSQKFFSLRDELYWNLKERFTLGEIQIPDDKELIAQLASIKCKYPLGKIKIESKEEMKKRGLSSPDKADALALSFIQPAEFYSKMIEPEKDWYKIERGGPRWLKEQS